MIESTPANTFPLGWMNSCDFGPDGRLSGPIKVRKAIEAHLDSPEFDVEKLCRHLAMSHSQVHRKLSALTGLSATHFIRYVRLVKAKEMINSSGYSIAAIAMDCGFNDPAYFSRVFKQEFGVTPQVWREKNSV